MSFNFSLSQRPENCTPFHKQSCLYCHKTKLVQPPQSKKLSHLREEFLIFELSLMGRFSRTLRDLGKLVIVTVIPFRNKSAVAEGTTQTTLEMLPRNIKTCFPSPAQLLSARSTKGTKMKREDLSQYIQQKEVLSFSSHLLSRS